MKIDDMQFGFMPEYGTNDTIFLEDNYKKYLGKKIVDLGEGFWLVTMTCSGGKCPS